MGIIKYNSIRTNSYKKDTAIMQTNNSLGIPKKPADTRVVVAMSGGVDSSVVAAKLKSEGYDVIGITLQLYTSDEGDSRKGACCAGTDINDARRVAEKMDFPHYVFDYKNKFKESVIDNFVDSYLAAETPVPCIKCNEEVKFHDLLKTAKQLNADCMATGHYVRRKIGENGAELHKAIDENKDQSYFLFATSHEQLNFLRFPLGHLKSKAETRALAEHYGLTIANKPDSQDICFVTNKNYASLIRKLRPESIRPGDIIDLQNNVLGQHNGIVAYTIGQRRGLGIGGGSPYYVLRIDAKSNTVIVGKKKHLGTKRFSINSINWLGATPFEKCPKKGWEVSVKVRSTRPEKSAFVIPSTKNSAQVDLDLAEEAIAPGQACVFYSKSTSQVLGGGWINRSKE